MPTQLAYEKLFSEETAQEIAGIIAKEANSDEFVKGETVIKSSLSVRIPSSDSPTLDAAEVITVISDAVDGAGSVEVTSVDKVHGFYLNMPDDESDEFPPDNAICELDARAAAVISLQMISRGLKDDEPRCVSCDDVVSDDEAEAVLTVESVVNRIRIVTATVDPDVKVTYRQFATFRFILQ